MALLLRESIEKIFRENFPVDPNRAKNAVIAGVVTRNDSG